MKALPTTLAVTIVPLLFGFVIGVAIALIRLYKVKYIHPIASFYVSFLRGTPMILHLLIIFQGLPILYDSLAEHYGWALRSKDLPVIVFVFIAFSITAGAYMSEMIRSGILAVNRGQLEAAYSVGMTTPQAMLRIVFPQAISVSLPNLVNLFVGFLHGSSLAFTVTLMELTGKANIVASEGWNFLEANITVGIIYWALTFIVEQITGFFEKRLNIYSKGSVA